MESGEKVDKVLHFVHQLKTISGASSGMPTLVEHIRHYLKRHPGEIGRFVTADGVALVSKLLTYQGPVQNAGSALGPSPRGKKSVPNGSDSPSSPETAVSQPALLLLAALLTDAGAKRQLSNQSFLSTLVPFLGPLVSDGIRLACCRCLSNLVHNSPEYSSTVLARCVDLPCTVLQLLDSATFHEIVIRLIRQMAPYGLLRKAFLRQGAVGKLTTLLDNDDAATVQNAIMCITSLVGDYDSLETDILRQLRATVPHLVQLAAQESLGVQQSALDLLTRLTQMPAMRMDLGSKGVIACFLEHLAFDEFATTVCSMQKKIAFALTLACHEGYNRAKLTELDGLRVLVGMLASSLYQPIHLHILSSLPEFRHDPKNIRHLISLGIVPLVMGYLENALDVSYPDRVSEDATPSSDTSAREEELAVDADMELSLPTALQTPPRLDRLSLVGTPAVSPPSITEDLRRDLMASACSSPLFDSSACSPTFSSAPTSPSSLLSAEEPSTSRDLGRYSPIVHPAAEMGLELDQETERPGSLKRSHSLSQEASASGKKVRVAEESMSRDDALKCIKYGLAFCESISYHAQLGFTKSLAVRPALTFLIGCLVRMTQSSQYLEAARQILHRLVQDRLCFEYLIKAGFVLLLQERKECGCDEGFKAKRQLLQRMRDVAESDFGFGELLHLCLRTPASQRMICIASASILLQHRTDRSRAFEGHGLLEQVMDRLLEGIDAEKEEDVTLVWALHGFFCEESGEDATPVLPDSDTPEDGCWYEMNLATDVSLVNDHVDAGLCRCVFDDETSVTVSRIRLAAVSPVFAAMLAGTFLEGQQDASLVPIHHTDPLAFQGIVHYLSGCRFKGKCALLTGLMEDPSGLGLLALSQLSDQYLLFDLRDFSAFSLIHHRLTPFNVASLFDQAQWLHLISLSQDLVLRVLTRLHLRPYLRTRYIQSLIACEEKESFIAQLRAALLARF